MESVASSVIFVAELDRSVSFYRDVFGCRVAVLEEGAALLLDPGGFQLYLVARGNRAQHALGGIGVQYLMWATDDSEQLNRFQERLRSQGSHADTYSSDGITFVEGRDPDGIQVVMAHPSPAQRPRSVLHARRYV